MATFDQCQREYDAMTPPDHDEDECPNCGALIKKVRDGVKCMECDWDFYPDYDDQPILGVG